MRAAAILVFWLAAGLPLSAQVDGYASLLVDVVPDLSTAGGNQRVAELRARLFAERRDTFGEHVRIQVSGYVDGLVADREATGRAGTTTDAIARPADLYVELLTSRFDVRVGMSRIVWGRLDELQPTDVVNPTDFTRFVLEGRGEARLAVPVARGRVFFPGNSTLEALIVPAFRAGRYDQLDEPSSPFNLLAGGVPVERDEPAVTLSNVQGGARFTSTLRRVDWGVSAYRGFRTVPVLTLDTASFTLRESFPRFTMVGGDVEAVRGAWGVRGEVAVFVEDELQSTAPVRGEPGRSVEGGVGVDRRAGEYRVAGSLLWSSTASDAATVSTSDVSLVLAADRSFARETRTLRAFAVYDPAQGTAFARVITAFNLRDNAWLEASGGLFTGSGDDTIGRMTRRDFIYARLKVYF